VGNRYVANLDRWRPKPGPLNTGWRRRGRAPTGANIVIVSLPDTEGFGSHSNANPRNQKPMKRFLLMPESLNAESGI